MSYKAAFPLFRDLNEREVKEFKACAEDRMQKGFTMQDLSVIHPVIRKKIIKLIEKSLDEQGELE